MEGDEELEGGWDSHRDENEEKKESAGSGNLGASLFIHGPPGASPHAHTPTHLPPPSH